MFTKTLHDKLAVKLNLVKYPLLKACVAEFLGTFTMIIFGCGVLAQAKLGKKDGKEHGAFIAISWNWGMAVMLGVFVAGGNGHGLINPAVTLAFASIGRIPWIRVPAYIVSQTLGAFLGALIVMGLNYENIFHYAQVHDAGRFLVNTTGDIFVTNPWVSHTNCFMDQLAGTAFLTAGALAIVDDRTWNLPSYLHPFFLGLLVFALVGAYGLNAGCALNPARDFGPRLAIVITRTRPPDSSIPLLQTWHYSSHKLNKHPRMTEDTPVQFVSGESQILSKLTVLTMIFNQQACQFLFSLVELETPTSIPWTGWKDAFSAGSYYFWIPIIGPCVGAILGANLYELLIGFQSSSEKPENELSSPERPLV